MSAEQLYLVWIGAVSSSAPIEPDFFLAADDAAAISEAKRRAREEAESIRSSDPDAKDHFRVQELYAVRPVAVEEWA